MLGSINILLLNVYLDLTVTNISIGSWIIGKFIIELFIFIEFIDGWISVLFYKLSMLLRDIIVSFSLGNNKVKLSKVLIQFITGSINFLFCSYCSELVDTRISLLIFGKCNLLLFTEIM
jgi:hypothetical protein